MNVILLILLIGFSIYFVYALLLLILKDRNQVNAVQLEQFPKVAVLVAARNEAHQILRCLEALSKVEYSETQIEFLIGNDASTDRTAEVIASFAQCDNRFRLIQIKEPIGLAKGKANVLAQLAHQTEAEYLFITDADIKVPTTWVKCMLSKFESGVDLVSSSTGIEGDTIWSKLQHMEWVYAFGLVNLVSSRGIPVSAVGNNMAIRSAAYHKTGGYERIPFSVTEDYALFKAVLKQGGGYVNFASKETLAWSTAQPNVLELLKQRRRWVAGGLGLPAILLLFLFLQLWFFPMLLALALVSWPLAVMVLVLKMFCEGAFMYKQWNRCGLKQTWFGLLLPYQFYTGVFSMLLTVYFLINRKVKWKDRSF